MQYRGKAKGGLERGMGELRRGGWGVWGGDAESGSGEDLLQILKRGLKKIKS